MLDTAWSLSVLHSGTEDRCSSCSFDLHYSPSSVLCTSEESYFEACSTALSGEGQHWALPQETARPTGDNSPHSQQVPQGCGGIHEGITGSLSQETGSQRGDLQKPNLIIFSEKSMKQLFLLSKGRMSTAVYSDCTVTVNRWYICNEGKHVMFPLPKLLPTDISTNKQKHLSSRA